jgi:hypothetical protein
LRAHTARGVKDMAESSHIPVAAEQELEVDEHAAADSAYGDDENTISTSVTSSVRNYRWEYG